jgi:hypothetical protein
VGGLAAAAAGCWLLAALAVALVLDSWLAGWALLRGCSTTAVQ